MTQPPLRPPAHLLLRPKAAATSSSTSLDALVTKTPPTPSRASSQTRQPSPLQAPPPTDVSDKATSALIRRVLIAHSHGGNTESKPINDLLPPLTSSNEVDLQLYAIIAILIKEFVASWYGKITPDQSFVEEVVRIIAHCTRALEQRIRSLDLESLVLNEIPEFLESHITGWRSPRTDCLVRLANKCNPQRSGPATKLYTTLQLLPVHQMSITLSYHIQHYRQCPIPTFRPPLTSSRETKRHTDSYSSKVYWLCYCRLKI